MECGTCAGTAGEGMIFSYDLLVNAMKKRKIKLAVYKLTNAATATPPAIQATLETDQQ